MRLDDYLLRYKELRSLHEKVKQEFHGKGLVHHNWNHILRDLANAVMIGEAENANMKIVLASILLHDIGRLSSQTDIDHHKAGAEMAPKYLKASGFADSEIEQVKHCIRSHGPRGIEEPQTLEASVCYDANVLSCSVGYVGVARVFDYFMREENIGVKEMLEIPSGKKGPRKTFYTRTGKLLGKKGFYKATGFWKQLDEELRKEEENVRKVIPSYKGD